MKINLDRINEALERVIQAIELLMGRESQVHVQMVSELIKLRRWRKIPITFFPLMWSSNAHMVWLLMNSCFRLFSTANSLKAPPGRQLSRLAEFLFSRRTNEMVFLPVISDMREEYFEALSQNRIWKARWVRIRGTWSFFAAMGLDRIFSVVSLCVKVWKSVS